MILIPFLDIVAVLPHYVLLVPRGVDWVALKISAACAFENPSNTGVRVPSKRFPKQPLYRMLCTTPRCPVPQIMKVCFILVLGHRYATCTLVFYRGVLKKNSCPECTRAPLFYRENGAKNDPCTSILWRLFWSGDLYPQDSYLKNGGAQVQTWIHRGYTNQWPWLCEAMKTVGINYQS